MLTKNIDDQLQRLSRSSQTIGPQLSGLRNSLQSYVPSDPNLLTNALNQAHSNASGMIPSDPSLLKSQLQAAIDSCSYLQLNPLYSSPNRIFQQMIGCFAGAIIQATYGVSQLIELALAVPLTAIEKLISSLNFDFTIPAINAAFLCMQARNLDPTSRQTSLNSTLSGMNVGQNGLLDRNSLYGSSNMTSQQISGMSSTLQSTDNVHDQVNNYINSAGTWI